MHISISSLLEFNTLRYFLEQNMPTSIVFERNRLCANNNCSLTRRELGVRNPLSLHLLTSRLSVHSVFNTFCIICEVFFYQRQWWQTTGIHHLPSSPDLMASPPLSDDTISGETWASSIQDEVEVSALWTALKSCQGVPPLSQAWHYQNWCWESQPLLHLLKFCPWQKLHPQINHPS